MAFAQARTEAVAHGHRASDDTVRQVRMWYRVHPLIRCLSVVNVVSHDRLPLRPPGHLHEPGLSERRHDASVAGVAAERSLRLDGVALHDGGALPAGVLPRRPGPPP